MSEDIFDDDDNDAGPELLVEFTQEITLIRLFDAVFIPSTVTIKAEVWPLTTMDDDDFDVAITKARFWLTNIASRCIAFTRGNENARKMLIDEEGCNLSNNLIMLTPYEPMDDHLAALFQSKLTALADGAIVFGSVEIKSNNVDGLSVRFVGNAEDVLPTMADWVGERSFFDSPWWLRDDASTLDVVPPEDADLSSKPSWAYSLDFLGNAIRPEKEVILRHDFKPTVIEGGNDGK